MRKTRMLAGVVVFMVAAGGCQLLSSANRYAAAPGSINEPFWCAPTAGLALPATDCQTLSAQLDRAVLFARVHQHGSNAIADGAVGSAYVTGAGAAFRFSGPTAQFRDDKPDTLLYDGTGAGAQVVGIEWNVSSASAPTGFTGANDVWTAQGGGAWRLRVWILRPFQNQPNAFASSHPCLASSGPIYDLNAACYTSTHPKPLEILVSNDDGYNSPGIDAAVQAMRALPNVQVLVSAPALNQSGTGGQTTPGGVTATLAQTLSGYPAYATNGFPADAVIYALTNLHANPELLVSGINNGQNIGPLVTISGTVGAARVGARADIPSVAVSQGVGTPPNYPAGATALTRWVADFLVGRAGPPSETVVNINVPTCVVGSIRGTANLPTATAFNGRPYDPSNCLSTVTTFADDIDGFLNGFITVSNVGVG